MGLTLTNYPVTTETGKTDNVFAGFSDVNIEFKREDLAINSISSGTDNVISIVVTGDLTGNLNVGESVYLYAIGTNYVYDLNAEILTISYSAPDTTIEINSDFIVAASSGYINYLQDYFVESKLVDVTNNDVKIYPYLINTSGKSNGIINVNVSIAVDLLKGQILENSGVQTDGRNKFKLMYREVWREENANSFTLLDNTPIIILYAADDFENEKFINSIELPRIYKGYPSFVNFLHSDENDNNDRIKISFNELDINRSDITQNNLLKNFNQGDFGIFQTNFNDNVISINNNTKYIKFIAGTTDIGDYNSTDYNNTDYNV